jgi:CDP-glucose 4,6-dehydratase
VHLDDLKSVYHGKKVLVTGHTGFKGSWLCVLLDALGAEIIGLSLPASTTSLFTASGLETICRHNICDVRNLDSLTAVVDNERPDMVFHLAAQSLVGVGRENPVETFATNVQGTVHLLEACRLARSIVVASSDKCYAPSKLPLRESDKLGSSDPYGASKAALEHVVSAYREQFYGGGVVAAARSGNVIAGGDWSVNRLLPDFLRAVKQQSPLSLRHPRACRAWQYVLVPLWGYLVLGSRILEDPAFASGWNFGPSQVASVSAVVHSFGKAFGETPRVRFMANSPNETMMLRIDSGRSEQHLKWTNKMSWEHAVSWTAEDYKMFFKTKPLLHMRHRVHQYAKLWST